MSETDREKIRQAQIEALEAARSAVTTPGQALKGALHTAERLADTIDRVIEIDTARLTMAKCYLLCAVEIMGAVEEERRGLKSPQARFDQPHGSAAKEGAENHFADGFRRFAEASKEEGEAGSGGILNKEPK